MSGAERRGRRRAAVSAVGLAIVWILAGAKSGANAARVFDPEGLKLAGEILEGLLRPDLSGVFALRVAQLLLESVAIGGLGLVGALLLGVPLALVSARLPRLPDDPAQPAVIAGVWLARSALAFFRAVPEIVWAYLFVRIFGLGPGPAVLAISLAFAGIVGKLFADLLEACDPRPVRALLRIGAGRAATLLFGAQPQVHHQWVGYALFRWECAVRSAAILGVVGAGGIGAEVALAIRYHQFDKLGTALIAIIIVVVIVEALSRTLRRTGGRVHALILAGMLLFGVSVLEVPWSRFFDAAALQSATDFVLAFLQPNLATGHVRQISGLLVETIAMALFGTGGAAVLAFFLATLAWISEGTSSLFEPPGRSGRRILGRTIAYALRAVFVVTRALPELVWALVFVVWVGPGAFAGALAIGAHTLGILGRLFAEVYEDADPGEARALEALGVGAMGRWAFAVLPLVKARLAAFAIFRFEVNLRAAAMVGFVGAGGIGDAIHTAISLFHMRDLAALLAALFVAVLTVEAAGRWVRQGLVAEQ